MSEFEKNIDLSLDHITGEKVEITRIMTATMRHDLDAQNLTFFAGASVAVYLSIAGSVSLINKAPFLAGFSFMLAIINIISSARYFNSRRRLRFIIKSLEKKVKKI